MLCEPFRQLIALAGHRVAARPTTHLDVGDAGREQFIGNSGHLDAISGLPCLVKVTLPKQMPSLMELLVM